MIICCELLFMVLIIPLTMIILFKLNQIQIFVLIVECLIQLELAGPLSSNLKPSTDAVSDVLTHPKTHLDTHQEGLSHTAYHSHSRSNLSEDTASTIPQQ